MSHFYDNNNPLGTVSVDVAEVIQAEEILRPAAINSLPNVKSELSLEKRLLLCLFSKKLQYFLSFLSFVYIFISVLSDTLEMDLIQNPNNAYFDDTVSYSLSVVKFSISLLFLIETSSRLILTSLNPDWFSIWNVLDFLVILVCLLIEGMFLFHNLNQLLDLDGYLIPFRLWYALRTLRQMTQIKERKEDYLLTVYVNQLEVASHKLNTLRKENDNMSLDLKEMQTLIKKIADEKTDTDAQRLVSSHSSWASLVPASYSIKNKNRSGTLDKSRFKEKYSGQTHMRSFSGTGPSRKKSTSSPILPKKPN